MSVTGKALNDANFHVISVGGTSFKRYLDLAKLLNIRTAVIRDNDGDFQKNCIENYKNYEMENAKVFFASNDTQKTFEICMYETNKTLCEALFTNNHIKSPPQEYMLANKAEAALRLLKNHKPAELIAPDYIKEALKWIAA
ncbi:MAG: hypothetical protein PHI11_04720 [Gallionella sp.]|nr:hypothetical protein [Gallionella sp.]